MNDFTVAYAWGLDFWRVFLSKPKFIRWLCKTIMGRYAWNELVGMKQSIEEDYPQAFSQYMDYGCEGCDYHAELDKYKNW